MMRVAWLPPTDQTRLAGNKLQIGLASADGQSLRNPAPLAIATAHRLGDARDDVWLGQKRRVALVGHLDPCIEPPPKLDAYPLRLKNIVKLKHKPISNSGSDIRP